MKDPAPIRDEVLQEIHKEFIGSMINLMGMSGSRPKAYDIRSDYYEFDATCDESLWDSVPVPTRSKIASVRKDDLVDWVVGVGTHIIKYVYPMMKKQYSVDRRYDENEKKFLKYQEKFVEYQEEMISSQRALVEAQAQLVKLQAQLLEKREEAIANVQNTAKEEMKSFASVLQKGCATALAPHRIQRAVVAATSAEDRSSNLIVYGLPDSPGSDEALLPELWTALEEKPAVKSAQRLGRISDGHNRPLKISLASRETLMSILRKKTQLKDSEVFSRVYLSPDLTPEEREARGTLVKELKKHREENPGKKFKISGGKVLEVSPGTQ